MIKLASILILTRPLNVFDLETDGVGEDARILQIAVTMHYPDKLPVAWSSLVNSGRPIPPEVTAIHHITDDMVKDAPTFNDMMINRLMQRAFTNVDYCGFNIGFDLGVMKRECKRVGYPWNWEDDDSRVIDGLTIFRIKHPRDLSAAHQTYLKQPRENAHDAGADVIATERVIYAQLEQHVDLPRDVEALALFCAGNRVDKTGKLKWVGTEMVISFGKYNGTTLRDALRKDRQYFTNFVLPGGFPSDFKRIVTEGLGGVFPFRVKV